MSNVSAETNEAHAWKQAALAWLNCASIHRTFAKGVDPLFEQRQRDYTEHAEQARQQWLLLEEIVNERTATS